MNRTSGTKRYSIAKATDQELNNGKRCEDSLKFDSDADIYKKKAEHRGDAMFLESNLEKNRKS